MIDHTGTNLKQRELLLLSDFVKWTGIALNREVHYPFQGYQNQAASNIQGYGLVTQTNITFHRWHSFKMCTIGVLGKCECLIFVL